MCVASRGEAEEWAVPLNGGDNSINASAWGRAPPQRTDNTRTHKLAVKWLNPFQKSNQMCLRPHTRADEPPHSALPRWWLHSILCRCVMQLLNLIRALCCRCYRHWPSAAHKCHRNIFLKKTNNAHTHINLHAHGYVCACVSNNAACPFWRVQSHVLLTRWLPVDILTSLLIYCQLTCIRISLKGNWRNLYFN